MALSSVGLSTHIMNNNLRSGLLLLGFPVLLLSMIYGFSFILAYGEVGAGSVSHYGYTKQVAMPLSDVALKAFWDTTLYAPWVLLGAGIWFIIAWFGHAGMIRAATGAHGISRSDAPEIYKMLENMCIIRGIKTPKLNIINSPALNAFASGINENSYSITLTRGIIDALEPDELEAVMAHELTHIINRDVRLLIISIIFVGMIGFLAQMLFRFFIYGFGRNRDTRKLMLIAFVVLIIGYFFSTLIRFGLSRSREYLADAGSVEITKNPSAMMRALMRISGQSAIDGMPSDVQQLCLDNDVKFLGLFATHPSIPKRIKIISEMTNSPIPQLKALKPKKEGYGQSRREKRAQKEKASRADSETSSDSGFDNPWG